MAFKRLFILLIAVMFILPSVVFADDFGDDDFGGGGEEDDFGSFEEEKKEDEPFDAEESAENKEKDDQQKSDEAMRDLLGEEAPEKKEEKKEEKKDEAFDAIDPIDEVKKEEKKAPAGLKPVLLVKGGFTLLGQYEQKNADGSKSSLGSMFGSVDEGLLGAEYEGSHVIAKGTMNIRTENPLINKGNNPLMIKNLHSIQNGAMNGLYELYGGMKFFGLFVKAGKMTPEYGLMNSWQKLGMGFSTPFLTRSLNAVEGFIPETDAGFALGYENTFAGAHTIHLGLMLGTGSHDPINWKYDKTMGLY
jgi:hypothetical protein